MSVMNRAYVDFLIREERMLPRMRDGFARSYKPIFEKALQRVVNNEVESLKGAIANGGSLTPIYLKQVPHDLRRWVRPTQYGYAQDTIKATANETGLDLSPENGTLLQFVGSYADIFQKRYTSSHLAQLQSLPDMASIEERLSEWQEKESEKRATDEIVRLGQATFLACVFSYNMAVVWRTRGKSCSYCNRLNGRKIKKGQSFVKKMDSITPDNSDEPPMKIYVDLQNPPAHQKCDCFLSI